MRPINTFYLSGKTLIIHELKIHRKLAISILNRNASLIRSYGLWCILRQAECTHFSYSKIIEEFANVINCHPMSVRRWINEGEGIFWKFAKHKGEKRIWLIGKKKVFKYFDLTLKGNCLFLVKTELIICKKLQRVKANLFSCWIDKKNIIASRDTIEGITYIHKRTQARYDQQTRTKRQYNYYNNGDESIQLPNRYFIKHCRKFMVDLRKKKYNFESAGNNADESNQNLDDSHQDCFAGTSKRIFFNSEHRAKEEAVKRSKKSKGQLFYKSEEKGRFTIWKMLDYSLI